MRLAYFANYEKRNIIELLANKSIEIVSNKNKVVQKIEINNFLFANITDNVPSVFTTNDFLSLQTKPAA